MGFWESEPGSTDIGWRADSQDPMDRKTSWRQNIKKGLSPRAWRVWACLFSRGAGSSLLL